jgi:hypothetical protein
MTDNLRDCIAAALFQALNADTQNWEGHIDTDALADAVIRDVLTPEFLADLVIAAVQKAADDE